MKNAKPVLLSVGVVEPRARACAPWRSVDTIGCASASMMPMRGDDASPPSTLSRVRRSSRRVSFDESMAVSIDDAGVDRHE